jgi:hypothetical protein
MRRDPKLIELSLENLLNINLIKPLLPKIVTQLLIDINLWWPGGGVFPRKKELDQ